MMQYSHDGDADTVSLDFEDLVARYYHRLYQFAFALTRSEADAWDLTQQTFFVWATKGTQLRDTSKVKTWLFTTLHRAFLQIHRKQARFPHFDLSEVEAELPESMPALVSELDSAQVLAALAQVDEVYQAPVALFYLEDCPYKEIARRLDVPLGTAKSRIARGIAQLRKLMASASDTRPESNRVYPGLLQSNTPTPAFGMGKRWKESAVGASFLV